MPCGIEGKGVTSLSEALGRTVTTEETEAHLIRGFSDALGCHVIDRPPEGAQDMLKAATSGEMDSHSRDFNNITTS